MTIEERANAYADRHQAAEFKYFGLERVYGYSRIYNAEKTAYEKGAKEQKAIDEEVRLKKSDDMTQAEYDREVAFANWYHQNIEGTPTYSDAIEWARKDLLDKACKIFCYTGCPHKTDSYNCLNNKCDTWKIFRRMIEE